MNGEQQATERLLTWTGPEPRRIDVAHVRLGTDRLAAHGSSTTGEYVLTYRLSTGPGWVTRRLDVRVDGEGWWRTVALQRGEDGEWSAAGHESGLGGSTIVRIIELPDLRPALDCDLGLCPLTNTMPMRRGRLVERSRRDERGRSELTMAWVAVPALEVFESAQVYEAGTPAADGGAQIRYSSGDFAECLDVDADGIVLDYPSIGRLLSG